MKVKWILIGEIINTHGVKGEVRVWPHTEFPERFAEMQQILLFRNDSSEPLYAYPLEAVRQHKNFIILKLGGIDTLEEAAKLRGMLIKVHRDDVMPLPPGRFYIFELIGLNVVTEDSQLIGTIKDVIQNAGANDIYVVQPAPGVTTLPEILIPVIPHVVLDIDLDQNCVLVRLLDGLLE